MASPEHKEWFRDPKDIKIVIVKNIEEVKDLIHNTEGYVLIFEVEGGILVLTKSKEVLEILKDSEIYNFEDYITDRVGELIEIDRKTAKEIITVSFMSLVMSLIFLAVNIYFLNPIVSVITVGLMILTYWLEQRAYRQILDKE